VKGILNNDSFFIRPQAHFFLLSQEELVQAGFFFSFHLYLRDIFFFAEQKTIEAS
jgi:hypothetical protein